MSVFWRSMVVLGIGLGIVWALELAVMIALWRRHEREHRMILGEFEPYLPPSWKKEDVERLRKDFLRLEKARRN